MVKINEKGQGVIEYALVLIFITAIAGYFLATSGTLGPTLQNAANNVANLFF